NRRRNRRSRKRSSRVEQWYRSARADIHRRRERTSDISVLVSPDRPLSKSCSPAADRQDQGRYEAAPPRKSGTWALAASFRGCRFSCRIERGEFGNVGERRFTHVALLYVRAMPARNPFQNFGGVQFRPPP